MYNVNIIKDQGGNQYRVYGISKLFKYDVKRVYLFGSLTRDRLTHHGSDVDLAVEGLISASYFTTLSDLYDLTLSGIEIDLVPMEDAYPELRERIIKDGKLLYERKKYSTRFLQWNRENIPKNSN